MLDPRDLDTKPPTNTMLYRIEIRCAQAWAESLYDAENSVSKSLNDFHEVLCWKFAWIQIHALRLGHSIEMYYPRTGHSPAWTAVRGGVEVKP